MNNVIIRRASLEDLSTIQELNNSLFKLEKDNYDQTLVNDWSLSEEGKSYFSDLIKNHYVIVALIDNSIVGYLAGSIEEKGSYVEVQYGEINNMLVNDEYRGYGIGKSLINNFKEYCKTNNISNIKVVASYKNKNAIEFYHKNGFEEFDITLTAKI
jgi:GNAT superfamily N-acetyltransferase